MIRCHIMLLKVVGTLRVPYICLKVVGTLRVPL